MGKNSDVTKDTKVIKKKCVQIFYNTRMILKARFERVGVKIRYIERRHFQTMVFKGE